MTTILKEMEFCWTRLQDSKNEAAFLDKKSYVQGIIKREISNNYSFGGDTVLLGDLENLRTILGALTYTDYNRR